MSDIEHATRPQNSISVAASAGTGKTWLLTSRILRLLLQGAAPSSILAISFTKKAAAEIDERIRMRLRTIAMNEAVARHEFQSLGLDADNHALLGQARGLYEQLLLAKTPLRINTFHGFCQSLLKRFPLESTLPPGFRVDDVTLEAQNEAWHKFKQTLRAAPESSLASAVDTLLRWLDTSTAVRSALDAFLHYRADWWAYTENEDDPAAYAQTQLEAFFSNKNKDLEPTTLSNEIRQKLTRIHYLLSRHPTETNTRICTHIASAIAAQHDQLALTYALHDAFLTKSHTPRNLKYSKVLEKNLGAENAMQLIKLHDELVLMTVSRWDAHLRQTNLERNQAWIKAGISLLDLFQKSKLARQQIDFADLEWHAYRLLTQERHAEWVQYKLDQRIDHLLVDEFQDTNPTQWRLLLPLLNEMSAGNTERQRSVFIVGDAKQSIYRFRRAEPRLFGIARNWLHDALDATELHQEHSWRSSPAIIEFINLVFGGDSSMLQNFKQHSTHHTSLPGKVTLMPLCMPEKLQADSDGMFRDPLSTPATPSDHISNETEARQVAHTMSEIIGTAINDGANTRPLGYGDILLLVRSRTHIAAFEIALREAGIPYIGASSSFLAEAIEIRDLVALLRFLIASHDNLSLAACLRSPIFDFNDDQLSTLALSESTYWWHALEKLVDSSHDAQLADAYKLLCSWRELANHIPTHDLLDRIFCDTDLISRMQAASPARLHARIESNLRRALDLALDANGGRYPCLSEYITHLEQAEATNIESLHTEAVRIHTIHGAKGLEAPAVFLVDAARNVSEPAASLRPIITWPASSERPTYFMITGRKAERDQKSADALSAEKRLASDEEANLLYVALTRARQILYISGTQGLHGPCESYLHIRKKLACGFDHLSTQDNGIEICSTESDDMSALVQISFSELRKINTTMQPDNPIMAPEYINPELASIFKSQSDDQSIRPSSSAMHDVEAQQSRTRGIALHRALELLTSQISPEIINRLLCTEFSNSGLLDNVIINKIFMQAQSVYMAPSLQWLFDSRQHKWARNEVPMLYQYNKQTIDGRVDRVVETDDALWIIDYKSDTGAMPGNLAQYAAPHLRQLAYYAQGAACLWPKKQIRLGLLFTACGELYEIPQTATGAK